MNELDRRDIIIKYLRIKPISHGQVYTFQIAIPESQVVELSAERHENLRRSLTDQGTNLIPLIVRRTEAYSEEEEYEVVFGADWCLVAKELNIEKLWVWVFDMTDEHAAATQAEIEQLVGSSKSDSGSDSDLDSLLEKKLKPVTAKLNKLISTSLDNPGNFLPNEKLGAIESRLENLISIVEKLANQVNITLEEKIDALVSKVTQLEERTTIKGIENNLNKQLAIIRQETNNLPQEKALAILTETQNNLNEQLEYIRQEIKKLTPQVNLLTANRDDVKLVLEGVNSRIASAAWSAIEYWRQQGRTMTWDNLKRSTRGGSEHKIPNFGEGTYRKLQEIGYINS